jgi:biopolymer transport protein ExbB
MSFERAFSSLASLGPGWVFLILVGLSVLAGAIAVDRVVCLVAARDDVARLKSDVVDALRRSAVLEAIERLRKSSSFEAKVALAGLASHRSGARAAEERMAGASQQAKLAMERNLSVLATVGSNAPFVGLLGTVLGIIRAFRMLDASQGHASSHLLGEIGEALIATAVGLLVALPAIALYNAFQRAVATRLAQADVLGREVLAFFKDERSPSREEE